MYQTANTTRLPYSDPELLSIGVSQFLYPSDKAPWRANSVILITGDDFRLIVPGVSFVHFPVNAPVLFSNTPYLSNVLFQEILRLNPSGENSPAHVILIGEFHPDIIQQFHQYGYSTLHFHYHDPFVQSYQILRWREKLIPPMMPEMITKNTFLISVENNQESLPAYGFSAHMGTPILYSFKDSLPELTKKILQEESHRNVTIMGSENTISKQVEEACRRIVKGHVERFDGRSLPHLAVNFSRNKSKQTDIGWGRNTPGKGDAFTFFRADWRYAMIAAPLSHLGKHTPLLPLPEFRLPNEYVDYLEFLRPRGMHPEPPFMHAFILGDLNQIPFQTQLEIAEHIEFKETMEHH